MNILEQVKSRISQGLISALERSGLAAPEDYPEIILEVPKEKQHGDFSTNLAMQLTRIAKQNPRVIAENIVEHLDQEAAGIIQVEIAGPGFINLFTDKSYLYDVIGTVAAEGERYGRTNLGRNEKVQIEFVSANPTGSLHLGHARGAAFGDSLCNVLDFAGYEVSREYYINDAGNQVDNLTKSLEARYRQALGQTGAQAEIPEDGYHGEDIRVFGQQLADQEGDRLLHLSEEERVQYFRAFGLEQELNKIKRDLERFRVSFDVWFSESSLYGGTQINDVLQRLKNNGESYEMDGATWLKTTAYGDDKDRVLIKQDGSFTYLTPDIAYHKNKYSRGFDHLINIWGADHHGYIARMKAAMTALGEDASKLTVLISQMVNLFQDGQKVKMSKRTGKAVTMEELMDEVGVDAIRYFFTMRSIDSHLDFDLDLALSQSNENPVYYVQYAHARICSIFRQAKEQEVEIQPLSEVNLTLLQTENESEILKKLAAFPEEIEAAATQYAPHRIIRYVYELSSMFHSYYRAERVITEDTGTTQARFALLGAVRQVLQNALRLIGVSAPEEM